MIETTAIVNGNRSLLYSHILKTTDSIITRRDLHNEFAKLKTKDEVADLKKFCEDFGSQIGNKIAILNCNGTTDNLNESYYLRN